jgi:DNA polymerase
MPSTLGRRDPREAHRHRVQAYGKGQGLKLLRITRTKSRCKECPLNGYATKVRGESANENPKIAFIGEAPGADEDHLGHPFVGSAGKELDRVLAKGGIHRHNAYLLNLANCRPPQNDLDSPEGIEAQECCRPGFEEELQALFRLGVRTLVSLGANPTRALGIEGSVHKVRGSVYEVTVAGLNFWCVPTFHPSYIIRGQWSEEPTMIADVEKAVGIAVNGYTPPKEEFLLFPTVKDIEARTRDILRKRPLLGVDIETTGFNYWNSEIFVMALALSGEEAFSIPFYSQGFVPYWKNGDLNVIKNCLAEILETCPTMYQNAPFDVSHLEYHGFKVGDIAHDVLLIHHAIHPELPHNLGYIVSIYGATPFWKDIKLRFPVMRQTPDSDLRTYNARDAVVLHQVLGPLLEDLKETGTEHIYYDYSLKLIRPTLSLTYNGMLLDRKRLSAWKKELEADLAKYERELRVLGDLPDDFNFQSPHHLSYWFYGETPLSLPKWKEEIASYDEPLSRKKKASAKYVDLVQRVDFYSRVESLARSKSKTKRTKSGYAKDEQALLLSRLAANTEIELLSKYRRPTAEHKSRLVALGKLRDALALFQKRQKTAKLLSTYTDFETGTDGRVHPGFKIFGTATGRLSSGGDE